MAAIVGWFTNWLAIQMSFNPIQFVGIGVIGWQGVIPRNRDRMAENISRVVGEDLLGREYLLQQVQSAALQENLHGFLAAKLNQVLDLNTAAVFARLPAAWQEQGLEDVVRRALEVMADYFEAVRCIRDFAKKKKKKHSSALAKLAGRMSIAIA